MCYKTAKEERSQVKFPDSGWQKDNKDNKDNSSAKETGKYGGKVISPNLMRAGGFCRKPVLGAL